MKKVKYFIDKIKNDDSAWKTFHKFFELNQEVRLKDIPSLEPLINEIFVDRTILLTQ